MNRAPMFHNKTCNLEFVYVMGEKPQQLDLININTFLINYFSLFELHVYVLSCDQNKVLMRSI